MEVQTPTLAAGASFGDIASATPEPEAVPTATLEDGVTASEPVATDGNPSSAEPEIPAAFKDATPEEDGDGEDKPDLSIDKDLEGHPVLKAKWESYKAQKEKGIAQWMTKTVEPLKANADLYEANKDLIAGFDNFRSGDPARAWSEFAELEAALVNTYGKRPGSTSVQTEEPDPEASKYGFEFPSDDKIVDVVLAALDKRLDERFGKLDPLLKAHETTEAERQNAAKAAEALPGLKNLFEVSSDPWINESMVAGAMKEYPGIPAEAAFKAKYAVEVGRYFAKHQGAPAQVRKMPDATSGARQYGDLKPGSSFGDILAVEASL